MKTASKRRTPRQTARTHQHKAPFRAIAKRKPPTVSEAIENVLLKGDLTDLTPEQRLDYYKKVCKSLGLNPLTGPFAFIAFRETENSPPKLQMYAKRDCTDQLRKLYGISIVEVIRSTTSQFATVEVKVQNKQGRFDSALGIVSLTKFKEGKGYVQLVGKELANALMKAETKAKRRATLSIAGLGFLDESEIESVEHYSMLTPGGRLILEQAPAGSLAAAQAVAQDKLAVHAKTGHLPASESTPAPAATPEIESSITESGGEKVVQGQLQRVTEAHTRQGKPFIKLLVSGTEYTLFDDVRFEKEVNGCKSLFLLYATSINEKVTFPVEEKQSGATLYRNVRAKGRLLIGNNEIDEGIPVIQRRDPGMEG